MMKGMYDNAQTFAAYATIDAGYYLLGQLQKEIDAEAKKKTHALISMVDKATGYAKEKHDERIQKLEEIIGDIVKAKKFINDPSWEADQKLLNDCKNIK